MAINKYSKMLKNQRNVEMTSKGELATDFKTKNVICKLCINGNEIVSFYTVTTVQIGNPTKDSNGKFWVSLNNDTIWGAESIEYVECDKYDRIIIHINV